MLGLFVNTVTADEEYYLVNRDKLTQHIQMALSKNQKNFFVISFCLFEL